MQRKNGIKKAAGALGLCLAMGSLYAQQEETPEKRPNILFISVDDLRPELGCYGKQYIHSPNIDKLAASGLTFNRAYSNIPVCGASRASLLSGIRPNRTRFSSSSTRMDEDVPGVVGLPMHFKNNGYHTVSLGKIYHHLDDGKGNWSEIPWKPQDDYILPESHAQFIPRRTNPNLTRGPAFENPDVPDHVYKDGMTANEAVRRMRILKNSGQPFFLSVGFYKPHLPFNAPKKYWDLYDVDEIKLPDRMHKPLGAPDEVMFNFGELRGYSNIPLEGPLNENLMRRLIHGYYAAVSYMDAQMGKVLDELEQLGLAENTIVILCGDNGFFLGEHGLWSKHANLEEAFHVPLILRAPGKSGKNNKTDALVEFVDIYPSLCELAGLDKPFHLQGTSFAPLAENPGQPWKKEVYRRWGRGETVVTREHVYTEWLSDQTKEITDRMLFNLRDYAREPTDISKRPSNKKLVQELSGELKKHMAERDKLIIP